MAKTLLASFAIFCIGIVCGRPTIYDFKEPVAKNIITLYADHAKIGKEFEDLEAFIDFRFGTLTGTIPVIESLNLVSWLWSILFSTFNGLSLCRISLMIRTKSGFKVSKWQNTRYSKMHTRACLMPVKPSSCCWNGTAQFAI